MKCPLILLVATATLTGLAGCGGGKPTEAGAGATNLLDLHPLQHVWLDATPKPP